MPCVSTWPQNQRNCCSVRLLPLGRTRRHGALTQDDSAIFVTLNSTCYTVGCVSAGRRTATRGTSQFLWNNTFEWTQAVASWGPALADYYTDGQPHRTGHHSLEKIPLAFLAWLHPMTHQWERWCLIAANNWTSATSDILHCINFQLVDHDTCRDFDDDDFH